MVDVIMKGCINMRKLTKRIAAMGAAVMMMASMSAIGASAAHSNTATVTGLKAIGSGTWKECRVYASGVGYIADVYLDWTNNLVSTKGYCYVTSNYWHYAVISGATNSASEDTKPGYKASTSSVKPGSSDNGTLTVGGTAW